ncbi:hypothetical protein C0Q70_15011 [Pomacea canaliculata]|uniref:Sulfatase N-terminal domain-containing protein n=1 Tax=Pomacea canaliculata TaxID=400727 RepID=A0A2T7NTM1_POMCA|nr:steryl-sulfatase-like [Pomacea canaliculata]PVD24528.1 hypothetical protein C0Q70_15011 [Pomacea canaliculata]
METQESDSSLGAKTTLCRWAMLLVVLATLLGPASGNSPGKRDTPNFLFFLADDLGYGDLGTFGNNTMPTPHLDRLAGEGVKLTHNIAAETVCTPSRAAFLTGRYPIRSGMAAAHPMRVFTSTFSAGGLPVSEVTFAELARQVGYRTAFLGKWHLGWSLDRSDPDHPHPLNHGFQYFYGVPLTNAKDFGDHNERMYLLMNPNLKSTLLTTFAVVAAVAGWLCYFNFIRKGHTVLIMFLAGLVCGVPYWLVNNMKLLNSFMYRNYEMVEQPIHLPSVTRKLVAESERFVRASHEAGQPFLLVVSWLHVQAAIATAPEFRGRSRYGPYGDAVMEMDWGVGRVVEVLDRLGLSRDTFVYFASDHGGNVNFTDWMGRQVGGYNWPFRGTKGQGSPEGAFRVPGIVRWPARIPAGQVIDEPVSLMDIAPTIADLLHVPLPSDRVMDGKSLVPLLTGETETSAHEFLFHYCQDEVHAVRYRPRTGNTVWKLSLREPRTFNPELFDNFCADVIHLDPPRLYDITSDPAESTPLNSSQYPGVTNTMLFALADHKQSIVAVPNQFTLAKIVWIPWKQDCCNFPACSCEDELFQGMFLD